MEPPASSIAKIVRPKLPRIFPRTRLFGVLDRTRDLPVVFVTGPAGSGKTTLVASYLDSRKLKGLWYQMDDGDAEPGSFFYYLGLAARKAAPRTRTPMPIVTPECLPALSSFARRYFEKLCARLGRPCCIVFDNYHVIPRESGFHAMIRDGLSRVPRGVRVIFLGRMEPPSEFAGLLAGGAMKVIDWEDLRLTAVEQRGILRLDPHMKFTGKQVGQILETTQGWVAGLSLIVEAAKRGGARDLVPVEQAALTIFDYFASEVFDKLDDGEREFLLKTAWLPSMTPSTAGLLTGNRRSRDMLERLSRNNYFTLKRKGPVPGYQYHALFREFLVRRARTAWPPRKIAAIQSQAAQILESDGQVESAIELLWDVEDWEGAARITLGQALALLSQGRSETLASWIRRLPRQTVDGTPWLRFWLGVTRLAVDPAEARSHFEASFKAFEAQEDPLGVFLAWSGTVDSILFQGHDTSLFDRWIEWLDGRVGDVGKLPPEIEARVACSMAGALAYRGLHRADVASWFERAWTLAQQLGDPQLLVQSAFSYILFNLWLGRFQKAAVVLDKLKATTIPGVAPPLSVIMLRTLEGYLGFQTGHRAAAERAIQDGIRIAGESDVHIQDAFLFTALIYEALGRRDLVTARKYMAMMGTSFRNRMEWGQFHYMKCWELWIEGEVLGALEHCKEGGRIVMEVGAPFHRAVHYVSAAHIHFDLGDVEKARMFLDESLRFARDIRSSVHEYQSLLVKAYFDLAEGRGDEGRETLRSALKIGAAGGLSHITIWWNSRMLTTLFREALDGGMEEDYVRECIRTLAVVPDEPPVTCEGWPWPLKIFTLGRFRIEIDGGPVSASRKARRKSDELIKALVAMGAENVRQEALSDVLWPGADGDKAQSALTTTAARVRKMLGSDRCLVVGGGCMSLDPRLCWVDARAFEETLRRAEEAKGKGHDERAMTLLDRALRLYGGDFVAEDGDPPWAHAARDRLRQKCASAAAIFSKALEGRGEHAEAARLCLKGLEADDLNEEMYRRLMICCERLGRRSDGVKAYQRCRQALWRKLGIKPSPETEKVYRRLS
jgi:LuxR family maltose regulon positive regulatory protein